MKIGVGSQGTAIRLARLRGAGLGLLALCLLLSGGCGGGGGGNGANSNTVRGALESSDQSFSSGGYVDFYVTTAASDGTATVEMDSDTVDSLLLVGIEDSSGNIQTITSDDNSAGGRNAKVTFQVTRGSVYHLAATTATADAASGSYALVYSKELGMLNQDTVTRARLLKKQTLLKK